MTIIGFNFTKVSAEKGEPAKGKISVNRKCTPTGVEEVKIGTGQKALRYTFDFACEYTPKVADVRFSGNITQLVPEDRAEEILSSWKDDNSIPPDVLEKVMNAILTRCHTEALLMSKELNIPPPFNLPKVKIQKKGDKKE